ncbi:porin [Labrys sp. KNU-23]|uniref:porin n=1 Tax=Labrys sp. KNU-23 TaxID=2789216 RepID=UPI0011EC1C6A|nr:porin [Labrys sp. KNU-23]QEN86247.1 porin [Labrys sp. KNU-23]
MTTKSLLLGTIAGIAIVGTAQAADLPMTKGEAVEYVKVCSAFGPGFFYIPGSDTCLKIGGEIRADYRGFGGSGSGRVETTVNGGTPTVTRSNFKWNRNNDRTAFNTQARIWFDARTQTDWGLLRSYFQINADSHPISHQGRGGVYNGNTFSIDKAFIQFGGLTAGYAHSFFGFYDNEYGDTIWAPYYAESNTVNLLAYTAQFGGGFSATLSVEDGRDHRSNVAVKQGGQQVPDVVGQLRWDQSWGSVAIQAAGHQFRSAEAVDANGVPLLATDPNYIPHKQKYGWAVGGTGLLKLPFIDGGHFIVEGQYADGALDYLGAGNSIFNNYSDYYFGSNNTFRAGKGWSVVGELGGNITPVLNANLVASYIDVRYDDLLGFAGKKSFDKEFTVAANLTYTIVKGLTIGAEVAYTRADFNLGSSSTTTTDGETTTTVTNTKATPNIWQAGIRIRRVF